MDRRKLGCGGWTREIWEGLKQIALVDKQGSDQRKCSRHNWLDKANESRQVGTEEER